MQLPCYKKHQKKIHSYNISKTNIKFYFNNITKSKSSESLIANDSIQPQI